MVQLVGLRLPLRWYLLAFAPQSFITDVEQGTFGGWAAGICRP